MRKKATIDAKTFSEGLDQVSRALQKSSYPALSEVSVRVEDGICILTATDLDTWLIKRIPAQGDDLAFVFSRTRRLQKPAACLMVRLCWNWRKSVLKRTRSGACLCAAAPVPRNLTSWIRRCIRSTRPLKRSRPSL